MVRATDCSQCDEKLLEGVAQRSSKVWVKVTKGYLCGEYNHRVLDGEEDEGGQGELLPQSRNKVTLDKGAESVMEADRKRKREEGK